MRGPGSARSPIPRHVTIIQANTIEKKSTDT